MKYTAADYIQKYKELETILNGTMITDYEAQLDARNETEIMSKMRLCRNIRNFIQHNKDVDFVPISKDMMDFLSERILEIKLQNGTVKDAMLSLAKCKAINENETIFNATKILYKNELDFIPVFSVKDEFLGTFSVQTLFSAINTENITAQTKVKKIVNLLTDKNLPKVLQTVPFCDVSEPKGLVVNTKDKVIGIFSK